MTRCPDGYNTKNFEILVSLGLRVGGDSVQRMYYHLQGREYVTAHVRTHVVYG